VLADTGRTDRRRQTPLLLDSEATTALRKLCRARKDMVAVRPSDHRSAAHAPGPRHLHPTAQGRHRTRRPPAGRDRRARGRFPTPTPNAVAINQGATTLASGSVAETKFDHDQERTQLSPLCVTEC
jgi:hypothetical protein